MRLAAIEVIQPGPQDGRALNEALAGLAAEVRFESLDWWMHARDCAIELSSALSDAIDVFRAGKTSGLVVTTPVTSWPSPETPENWMATRAEDVRHRDMWISLLSTRCGAPFSWTTLQAGRWITDIMPIRGQEAAQTGHGSTSLLEFHVEDAFDDRRCDFLVLHAMRNTHGVATTISSINDVKLDPDDWDVLKQSRYLISPDTEHLRNLDKNSLPSPRRVPVVEENDGVLELRVDPAFCEPVSDDPEAARAWTALCEQLADNLQDLVLTSGQTLLLNNRLCVHGRRPFRARYDGSDRWLRRVMVRREPGVPTKIDPFVES